MLRTLLVAVAALCLLLLDVRDATACGVFASRRPPTATESEIVAHLPFLTVEQVLLVWDKETGIEDFIRETRFDRADETFGFVVPTPTKPEVSAVKKAPFEALRKAYPFAPPPERPASRGLGGLGDKGSGAGGGGAAPPPVVVLSEQRIGSFTAFTLSATDAGAFDKWLSDNGFTMAAEAKPWLAHYVTLQFFFVAFRYEPKVSTAIADEGPAPAMTSETVRIRFKTPNPYYPYLEPAHVEGAQPRYQRMLTGWLVTREPMKPVAFKRSTNSARGWQRPWGEGLVHRASTDAIVKAIGPELRPIFPKADNLVVQTFQDHKVFRTDFGDVLMVPFAKETVTAEDEEARKFLLPVVDPTLLDPDVTPDAGSDGSAPPLDASTPIGPVASTTTTTTTPSKSSPGCSAAPAGKESTTLLVAIAGIGIVAWKRRRSRAHLVALVALLVACRKAPTEISTLDPDAADKTKASAINKPPTPTPLALPTRDERQKTALAILAGESPSEGINADSQFGFMGKNETSGRKGDAQIGASTSSTKIADLDRVIAGLRSRFRACYQTGLNTDSNMSGKIVIAADLDPAGAVTTSTVQSNSGVSPQVAECCARVLARAQFEAGSDKRKMTVPISFVPQK